MTHRNSRNSARSDNYTHHQYSTRLSARLSTEKRISESSQHFPIDPEDDMKLFTPDRQQFSNCRGGTGRSRPGRPGVCDEGPSSVPIPNIPPHILNGDGGGEKFCFPFRYVLLIFFIACVMYLVNWNSIFSWITWSLCFCKPDEKPIVNGDKQLTIDDVNDMIKNEIAKYDSDKTGLADLGLESAGGKIISTRKTKNKKTQVTFFGIPIYSPQNSNCILKPGIVAGECWAFNGEGQVVIKLMAPAFITGLSVEHLPKANSPTNDISSAPKIFELWGLTDQNIDNVDEAHLFGEYQYKDNGVALQYFSTMYTNKTFQLIELKIKSNHGSDTTCLYRIRIHGNISTLIKQSLIPV